MGAPSRPARSENDGPHRRALHEGLLAEDRWGDGLEQALSQRFQALGQCFHGQLDRRAAAPVADAALTW
jgi:hypothetical protein